MEIRLFGKQLFSYKNGENLLMGNARNYLKESLYLPDFYIKNSFYIPEIELMLGNGDAPLKKNTNNSKNNRTPSKEYTPKEVYEMKMLNDNSFKMNTDSAYINLKIKSFEEKLKLLKSSERDMENGVREVSSVLIRFENRKKYSKHEKFYSEFPYTTTAKISDLLKKQNHLKLGTVEQFVAEIPDEAINIINKYTEETKALCWKRPLFYIIANKKDFEKTETRKDPILLAQSPFGHFWQILGAWDKEMLFLDDL